MGLGIVVSLGILGFLGLGMLESLGILGSKSLGAVGLNYGARVWALWL